MEVLVGSCEPVKFTIHKPLLVESADFFRAAFEGGFKEAGEGKLSLPDDSSDVFQRFQLWLYSGSPMNPDEDLKEIGWDIFIRLYVFAEKYDLVDLQNITIDFFMARQRILREIPTGMAPVNLIYENTSERSPLRRILVDKTAQLADLSQHFKDDIFIFETRDDFKSDVLGALYLLAHKGAKKHDWDRLGCTYHIHPPISPESGS